MKYAFLCKNRTEFQCKKKNAQRRVIRWLKIKFKKAKQINPTASIYCNNHQVSHKSVIQILKNTSTNHLKLEYNALILSPNSIIQLFLRLACILGMLHLEQAKHELPLPEWGLWEKLKSSDHSQTIFFIDFSENETTYLKLKFSSVVLFFHSKVLYQQ